MGNTVCGIFMDLAKAFNSVNHRILINKLEHYGVRGIAINLIKSYLTNRIQYTVSKEKPSNLLPVTIGVPQDSVLGPFLFLVYINDLPNSCNSEVLLYADDAVLLCNDKTRNEIKDKSEMEVQKIENWVIANKLTINYSKSNFILFSNQSQDNKNENLYIRALNGTFKELTSVKYLGVIVDNKLSWNQHTQSVVKKVDYCKRHHQQLRHYASLSILKNVYFSLVYSYLQ